MNLYDVLADGYHTPLTKAQITELFQAGRFGRNQPCKQIEKKEWRTVDELFPLLKYDSSRQFYQPPEQQSSQARNRAFAIAISALAILGVSLGAYLALRGEAHAIKDTATAEVPALVQGQVVTSLSAVSSASENAAPPSNLTYSDELSRQARLTQGRWAAVQRQQEQAQAAQLQLAQDRASVEQRQREQAQAAQLQLAQNRANAEQRERELQKEAGRTERIPLDQFATIHNVGGWDVVVKIHDHDITTIDVWTGFTGLSRLTKQKGISGSRTDETLIYSNSRACLYYVWEISGRLNHCLLRVREN